jgi:hypothetical protein
MHNPSSPEHFRLALGTGKKWIIWAQLVNDLVTIKGLAVMFHPSPFHFDFLNVFI